MAYSIVISRSAEKDFDNIPSVYAKKISSAIDSLAYNPRPHGCKKLKGGSDLWRIRTGDYRILYHILTTIFL